MIRTGPTAIRAGRGSLVLVDTHSRYDGGVQLFPYRVLDALTEADVLLVISHGNTMRAAAHLLVGNEDEDYASVPRLSNCRAHVLQSHTGERGTFTSTQTSV